MSGYKVVEKRDFDGRVRYAVVKARKGERGKTKRQARAEARRRSRKSRGLKPLK